MSPQPPGGRGPSGEPEPATDIAGRSRKFLIVSGIVLLITALALVLLITSLDDKKEEKKEEKSALKSNHRPDTG